MRRYIYEEGDGYAAECLICGDVCHNNSCTPEEFCSALRTQGWQAGVGVVTGEKGLVCGDCVGRSKTRGSLKEKWEKVYDSISGMGKEQT